MHYYSLHHKSAEVSFKDAVIKGIAPDKGLYFPIKIDPLDPSFFKHIKKYSNQEIAFQTIKQFVGNDIPETVLKDIINDTLSFDFPLVFVLNKNHKKGPPFTKNFLEFPNSYFAIIGIFK